MAVHDYHENLKGYSPAQVLVDGCAECGARGKSRGLGIGGLDQIRFARAWKRAADRNNGRLDDVSKAEAPMLDALWAVQVKLEERGFPVGEAPRGVLGVVDALSQYLGETP